MKSVRERFSDAKRNMANKLTARPAKASRKYTHLISLGGENKHSRRANKAIDDTAGRKLVELIPDFEEACRKTFVSEGDVDYSMEKTGLMVVYALCDAATAFTRKLEVKSDGIPSVSIFVCDLLCFGALETILAVFVEAFGEIALDHKLGDITHSINVFKMKILRSSVSGGQFEEIKTRVELLTRNRSGLSSWTLVKIFSTTFQVANYIFTGQKDDPKFILNEMKEINNIFPVELIDITLSPQPTIKLSGLENKEEYSKRYFFCRLQGFGYHILFLADFSIMIIFMCLFLQTLLWSCMRPW